MRRISAARAAGLRVTRFACSNSGGSAWPNAAIAKRNSRMAMIPGFIVASLFVEDFEHVIASFFVTHDGELLDQLPLHFMIGLFSCQGDQIGSVSLNEQGLNRHPAQLRVFFVAVNLDQRRTRFLATKRPEAADRILPYSAIAFCGGNMNQFTGIAGDAERIQDGLLILRGRS